MGEWKTCLRSQDAPMLGAAVCRSPVLLLHSKPMTLSSDLQFAGGVGGAACLAIEVIELEMRRGEIGVEARGGFKFAHGVVALFGELMQDAQVVMRHWLVGHQLEQTFELGDGRRVLALLLEG